MTDVIRILEAIERGEQQAEADLLLVVHDELRRLVGSRRARAPAQDTPAATGLVQEAYLRLVGCQRATFAGRGHFFAAAAESMRRILVDRARCESRPGHEGDRQQQLELIATDAVFEPGPQQLLALDEALDRLADEDGIKANIVKLRYFAGLTPEQVAQITGLSPVMAGRYWSYARAWLYHEISGNELTR